MELTGAAVRNAEGALGRIVEVVMPWVTLGWVVEGAPRVETIRFDLDLDGVEVLTIEDGWVPLNEMVEVFIEDEDGPCGLVEDIDDLLAEKVDRRPFKRASSIGPGPRHGWAHGPKLRKRDYWNCKCSKYKCLCKGKEGEKKKIKLSPEYKSGYNKQYKQWHRARLQKAAPGHFIGRSKKDMARKAKNRATYQKAANKRRKYK
jgi:hypothetical protein